jgi:hypothetical protein
MRGSSSAFDIRFQSFVDRIGPTQERKSKKKKDSTTLF